MRAEITTAVAVALAFVGLAVALGCGEGAAIEKESNLASVASTAPITIATRGNANTSANGRVMTTLGEYVVGVRSDTLIAHVFQEAQPGFAERLFLRHFVETETGENVAFEYDYTDGTRSFRISEEPGFITITKNREELVGKEGAVTIEPVGTSSIRVSFDQLAVGRVAPDTEWSDFIGSGAVEGPTHRVCRRASEVAAAENVPAPPPAMPVHDEAWIGQFCGP